MIKIENVEVFGWEAAIRGMRNPKNSWDKGDSCTCIDSCDDCTNFSVCTSNYEEYFRRFWLNGSGGIDYAIGPNDHKLMMTLAKAGTDHGKYRRMINVFLDITAPFYWWKEFDTYKVGTVANSCSTMHKLTEKEFELSDFSCEHLEKEYIDVETIGYTDGCAISASELLRLNIEMLNHYRDKFVKTEDKKYWWQMIQLLPTSYNQKRTIQLNYEVLANMYKSRKNHKLDEWHDFCHWIESLPYSEIITLKSPEEKEK